MYFPETRNKAAEIHPVSLRFYIAHKERNKKEEIHDINNTMSEIFMFLQ